MSKEAMKLALEALEEIALAGMSVAPEMIDSKQAFHARQAWRFIGIAARALEPVKKALAEQPAQQDSTCSNALRIQHKPYPRTCKKCGLGPCVELAQQALDKKADNARELGLDYEPVPENFIDALKFDVAMREWVGLTPHERMMCRSYDIDTTIDKTEAKLKEKNT